MPCSACLIHEITEYIGARAHQRSLLHLRDSDVQRIAHALAPVCSFLMSTRAPAGVKRGVRSVGGVFIVRVACLRARRTDWRRRGTAAREFPSGGRDRCPRTPTDSPAWRRRTDRSSPRPGGWDPCSSRRRSGMLHPPTTATAPATSEPAPQIVFYMVITSYSPYVASEKG